MGNCTFKCPKCKRTLAIDAKITDYKSDPPCPFCGMPLYRIYIDQLDMEGKQWMEHKE